MRRMPGEIGLLIIVLICIHSSFKYRLSIHYTGRDKLNAAKQDVASKELKSPWEWKENAQGYGVEKTCFWQEMKSKVEGTHIGEMFSILQNIPRVKISNDDCILINSVKIGSKRNPDGKHVTLFSSTFTEDLLCAAHVVLSSSIQHSWVKTAGLHISIKCCFLV